MPTSTRFAHLYNAACAAARVASGNVENGALEMNDEEQTGWRRRTLEWLRTHLTICQRYLTGDNDQVRDAFAQHVAHSLKNPDFATLRGAAIEQLPPDEQAGWRQYWVELQQTLHPESRAEQ
jgi:hypothetical protein